MRIEVERLWGWRRPDMKGPQRSIAVKTAGDLVRYKGIFAVIEYLLVVCNEPVPEIETRSELARYLTLIGSDV